jgi:hypothetical protein
MESIQNVKRDGEGEIEYLVSQIFRAALEVHKAIGPGLLESIYEYCLIKELQGRSLPVARQVKAPLYYKGEDTGKDFFLDIIRPVHQAQLLSYLKLADKRIGLLINFNVVLLKDGFKE